MTALLQWFSALFAFLGDWAGESFKQVKTIVTGFWGFLVIAVGLIWTILNHLIPGLELLLRTLDSVVTGDWNLAAPSGVDNILAIGNTFFPLDRFFQYAVAYLTLRIALAVYRVVKSWLPAEGST